MDESLVYLVLGATDSGRHEVIADLIGFGLESDDIPCLVVPEDVVAESTERLIDLKVTAPVAGWTLDDDRLNVSVPPETTRAFILVDGDLDPVDQVEAFSKWLPFSGFELGRVLTVVHCALLDRQKPLVRWYDACIHFSDVVLLNRRKSLSSKWVTEFEDRLKSNSMPCLVEYVKKGRVRNPALILYPEPRRISLIFDDEEHLYRDDDEATDEEAVTPLVDPWFERLVSGRRVKELPDIRKYRGDDQEV